MTESVTNALKNLLGGTRRRSRRAGSRRSRSHLGGAPSRPPPAGGSRRRRSRRAGSKRRRTHYGGQSGSRPMGHKGNGKGDDFSMPSTTGGSRRRRRH